MNLWYAVMRDNEDADWGTGSYDLDGAKAMARKYRALGNAEAYVAVIEEGDDPTCIDGIHDIDD